MYLFWLNIILCIASVGILALYLKTQKLSLTRPGPYWNYLLVGTIIIIFAPFILMLDPEYSSAYQMNGVDPSHIPFISILFYLQLICFFCGFFVFARYTKYATPYKPVNQDTKRSIVILSLILVIINAILIIKARTIPLFGYFLLDNVALARVQARNELTGIFGILFTVNIFLSWVLLYAAANLRLSGRRYSIYLLIAIFCLSWWGEKAPLILGIIGFVIYNLHFRRHVNFRKLLALAILTVVMMFGLFAYTSGGRINQDRVIFQLANRALVGNLQAFYQEFDYFKSDKPYWETWFPLATLVYSDPPDYARDMMLFTEGDRPDSQGKNTFLGAEVRHVVGYPISLFVLFFTGCLVSCGIMVFRYFGFLWCGLQDAAFWAFLSVMTYTGGYFVYPSMRFLYIPLICGVIFFILRGLIKYPSDEAKVQKMRLTRNT